ncbi:hypothetical protein BS47DRAFT_1345342 [Hydnum rufescens UP504]|uniref:Uncharacterized protein n=1 Tax=Hydnum rufescens UP504 TaxID=1448309 RepID=A0A9P6AV77_9AGAM|nr:hypothetical protein BS47DRAFT_1345342 [Hydnum rufescens UP504]
MDIPSTTTPTTIYTITPTTSNDRARILRPQESVRRPWQDRPRRFAPHFRGWRDEVPNQCVSHWDLQKSKTEM